MDKTYKQIACEILDITYRLCEEVERNIGYGIHIEELNSLKRDLLENSHGCAASLDDYIKVKLTTRGKDIYYHRNDEDIPYSILELESFGGEDKRYSNLLPRQMPEVDEDGYSKLSFLEFMRLYGNVPDADLDPLFEDKTIIIEPKSCSEK